MSEIHPHYRHCLLFLFDSGLGYKAAYNNLVQIYGEDAPSEATCKRWIERFKSGDTSTEDHARSGRPLEIDREAITARVLEDRRLTTRDLAALFGCSHSTIENILHENGFKSKLGCWVPHQLSADQLQQRITICHSLLGHYPRDEFLRQIIAGDEKWVLYCNTSRKRQWVREGEEPETEAKPDPHQKKVMLSVFFDFQGIIYWDLLPTNTTITAAYYCQQLSNLRQAIHNNRPRWVQERGKVRLLHDNARPHVAKVTRAQLEKFRWQILPHPAYSPDLSPADYALFRRLAHDFEGKQFDTFDEVREALNAFFHALPRNFFEKAIWDLAQRWETVIENDGQYITD